LFQKTSIGQTEAEKDEECKYLNTVRANFTSCCAFPSFVIWKFQRLRCIKNCTAQDKKGDRCCIQPCNFLQLNVLYLKNAKNITYEIDQTGLANSFLLSVGNDTRWRPTIENSAKKCYDLYKAQKKGKDCLGE
jgi:hypothetical protein